MKKESKNKDLEKTQETLPDIFTQTNAALAGIEEQAEKVPVDIDNKADYNFCAVMHKSNKKVIAAIRKYSKEKSDEIKEIFESKKLEITTQENAILNRLDVVQLKLGTSRTNYEDAIEAEKLAEREKQLEVRKAEALRLKKIEDEILAYEMDQLFEIKKEQASAAKKLQDEKDQLQKEREEFEAQKAENKENVAETEEPKPDPDLSTDSDEPEESETLDSRKVDLIQDAPPCQRFSTDENGLDPDNSDDKEIAIKADACLVYSIDIKCPYCEVELNLCDMEDDEQYSDAMGSTKGWKEEIMGKTEQCPDCQKYFNIGYLTKKKLILCHNDF